MAIAPVKTKGYVHDDLAVTTVIQDKAEIVISVGKLTKNVTPSLIPDTDCS